MMLTRRRDHHYGDTVEYHCNLGYFMSGNGLLTCDDNGQWSPSGLPLCQGNLVTAFFCTYTVLYVMSHHLIKFCSDSLLTCNIRRNQNHYLVKVS